MINKSSIAHDVEKSRQKKTAEFVDLYRSAAETAGLTHIVDKPKSNSRKIRDKTSDNSEVQNYKIISKKLPTKSSKNKQKYQDSSSNKEDINKSSDIVKSIMKEPCENKDESEIATTVNKRKKRNKSVSFMLEDNEEVVVKKTKNSDKKNHKHVERKEMTVISKSMENPIKKKSNKKHWAEKENQLHKENVINIKEPNDSVESPIELPEIEVSNVNNKILSKHSQKKIKKNKNLYESEQLTVNLAENENMKILSRNKLVTKKRESKLLPSEVISDGQPQSKFRKKHVKTDVIAEDLENLKIGDNAHTLTNMLDEMTVADKIKYKKNKNKKGKNKKYSAASNSSNEILELEQIEEGREKVKWERRKWNKDKKGEIDDEFLTTSVIVENLPLKIICTYKVLLSERFSKFGPIKKIGVAEVYPTDDLKPVFTTTVYFVNEDAVIQALEEDNSNLEGNRIRMKRPLPPTETTAVLRTYADINEQILSSVFSPAGRVRSTRILLKGKKFMATAFIEFDGPDAVERAIKMAEDARIGGKKLHVSKFEQRTGKKSASEEKQGVRHSKSDNSHSIEC